MTEQVRELQQELATLVKSAADRFDPVAFRYIQALLARAQGQSNAVASVLESRARTALSSYTRAYQQMREYGCINLTGIEADWPESHPDATVLFETGQFKQLQKLADRLHAQQDSKTTISGLTTLLNQQAAHHGDDPDSTPLDELLRNQEAELVSSLGQQAVNQYPTPRGKREELKSARRFRNAQAKLNADKLVTEAVAEIPDGAGPLNSQRLAARSLAAMRDLSPYYLSRFVTYMDTLFWLEQAEKKKRR